MPDGRIYYKHHDPKGGYAVAFRYPQTKKGRDIYGGLGGAEANEVLDRLERAGWRVKR